MACRRIVKLRRDLLLWPLVGPTRATARRASVSSTEAANDVVARVGVIDTDPRNEARRCFRRSHTPARLAKARLPPPFQAEDKPSGEPRPRPYGGPGVRPGQPAQARGTPCPGRTLR